MQPIWRQHAHVTQRSCWNPKSYSKEGQKRRMPLRLLLMAWPHVGWWMPAIPTPASSGLVYCWLFSGRVHMVILTPLIQARRTWTKTDTLLLLAHATQAQAVAMVRAPIREVCQQPLSTRRYLLQFPWCCWVQFLAELFGPRSWSRTVAYRYTVLPLGLHWYSSVRSPRADMGRSFTIMGTLLVGQG